MYHFGKNTIMDHYNKTSSCKSSQDTKRIGITESSCVVRLLKI